MKINWLKKPKYLLYCKTLFNKLIVTRNDYKNLFILQKSLACFTIFLWTCWLDELLSILPDSMPISMDPMDFRRVSEAPRVMPSVSGVGGSGYRLQDRATDTNVSGIWKNVLMVIHKYYLVMLRIQINTLVMQVLKIPCFLKGQGNIFCGFF